MKPYLSTPLAPEPGRLSATAGRPGDWKRRWACWEEQRQCGREPLELNQRSSQPIPKPIASPPSMFRSPRSAAKGGDRGEDRSDAFGASPENFEFSQEPATFDPLRTLDSRVRDSPGLTDLAFHPDREDWKASSRPDGVPRKLGFRIPFPLAAGVPPPRNALVQGRRAAQPG